MKRLGGIALALGLCLAAAAPAAAADETKATEEKKAEHPAAATTEVKPTTAAQATEMKATAMKEEKSAPAADEIAVIATNMGTIKIKFFPEVAPKAVENFKGLAKKGYYNGIIFHRVIDKFMIQGGDPTGTGRGGQSLWEKPFADEFSPKHRFDRKGLLAMANAGPATNGSQFFITLVPTPHLNDRHTIFGEVIEGMDVVEKIGKVKTGAMDKPAEPVTMTKVTIGPAAAKAAPAK
jgi:cyclophilin family peptidyl-prolyl cis-trans isomerase